MSKKHIYAAGAAGLAAVIAAALIFAYLRWGSSNAVLSMIPAPDGSDFYLLTQTKQGSYPETIASFFTEGEFALMKEGTPQCAAMKAAAAAKEAAMLIEYSGDSLEVLVSLRFDKDDTYSLEKGILPASLSGVLGGATVRSAKDNDIFTIESEKLSTPLYYAVDDGLTVMAAESSLVRRMLDSAKKSSENLGGKKWQQEKEWPAHIEICDGGAITADMKYKFPITIEAAWRSLEAKKQGDPNGEVRWQFTDLDKSVESYISSNMKPKKWPTSECVIPDPLLLSAGINIPDLKGEPKDWPFPLSSMGELALDMNLKKDQINEILSGQTVFSLGGVNRILWFTLPGLLVEFSGKEAMMKEFVDSFWNSLFFGAEIKPIEGYSAGGAAEVPFSVLCAAQDNIAIAGLISPTSLRAKNRLGTFLKDDESAVGWVLADMPRIGGTLSEMARLSSFMAAEEDDPESSFYDEYRSLTESEDNSQAAQNDNTSSPFDEDIADSFALVLKKMGRVLVVWEKPLSGRVNWYDGAK